MKRLLHDALEDQSARCSPASLRSCGVHPEVVRIVVALTKVKGRSYVEAIFTVRKHALAVIVKMADLSHNTTIGRVPSLLVKRPLQKVLSKQRQYLLSYLFLAKAISQDEYLVRMRDCGGDK